jgi:RHS repeat-associated protein
MSGMDRQGFTGKERDPETGLDYFGARYEMSAMRRWAAVDPQATKFPERGSYSYALDNPVALTDPDGECPIPLSSCAGRQGVDLAAGFTPGVSTAVDAVTVFRGRNPITGEKVGIFGRAVALVGLVTPLSGGQLRAVTKTAETGVQATRHADEVADVTQVATTRLGSDAAQRNNRTSQVDRAAFRSEREAYWKAEAEANPGNYTPENLERMKAGKAPVGADGKPMELHHIDGTPSGGVQPMTRTEHRVGEHYRRNHPWLERNPEGNP